MKRRWKRRRMWMGVIGFFSVVLTLVSFGLETFTESERYSTGDARETMENLTVGEVEISRSEFDNRRQLASTIPPPLPGKDDPTREGSDVKSSSGNGLFEDDAERPLEDDSAGPRPSVVEASRSPSRRAALRDENARPPEFIQGAGGLGLQSQDVAEVAEEEPEPFSNPYVASPALPDEMFDAVLLIGADASGKLADTIMLGLFPGDGSPPALVSIPRDLYLPNPCTKDHRRINANLWGCGGGVSGPELLGVVIEDFTGVKVDHYVRIEFKGFVELVEEMGGVEICFDHPTYDQKAGLDITEAGCRMVDGKTALAYARSRNARQLVNGEWQRAWASDITRQQHQRELLLQLADQLRESSLAELLSSFQALSHAFRLDSGWSIAEAVGWAWKYHDVDLSLVTQLRVAVDGYETPFGELVVVPTRPFNKILSEWWEPAAR